MTGRPVPLRAANGDRPQGGLPEPRSERRHPGVEANARLTATIGLVLIVMLFAEGLTLLSIRHLLSWHVAIGMALIPPVGVKIASTLWRFARYYLGDRRYRQAGPPHPLLRVLGPIVTLSTVALFATGVAAAVAGPSAHLIVTAHQASFVIWFVVMAIHVLGHLGEAARMAGADLVPLPRTRRIPRRGWRQAAVIAGVAAGIALGATTTSLAAPWQHFIGFHHAAWVPGTR
jgi:hypothetical protein